MSDKYGIMIGFGDAIDWVAENTPDCETKDRVIARMRYEADKSHPLAPKFGVGLYGRKYDNYSCANCGFSIPEAVWDYCPKCGRKISDFYAGRRKTQEEVDTFREEMRKARRMAKK